MTRARMWGVESEFSGWLRRQEDLDSITRCLAVTDCDFMVHGYNIASDVLGKRELQHMMCLEVKTYGGMPPPWQRQSLFFAHQLLHQKRKLLCSHTHKRRMVWHFGYYVLSLHGACPPDDPNGYVTWAHFDETGCVVGKTITVATLKQILRFELDPNTLEPLSVRRHHKTDVVEVEETTPLGFLLKKLVTFRS